MHCFSQQEILYLVVLADLAKRDRMTHFTFRGNCWVWIFPGTINSTSGNTQVQWEFFFFFQSSSMFAERKSHAVWFSYKSFAPQCLLSSKQTHPACSVAHKHSTGSQHTLVPLFMLLSLPGQTAHPLRFILSEKPLPESTWTKCLLSFSRILHNIWSLPLSSTAISALS